MCELMLRGEGNDWAGWRTVTEVKEGEKGATRERERPRAKQTRTKQGGAQPRSSRPRRHQKEKENNRKNHGSSEEREGQHSPEGRPGLGHGLRERQRDGQEAGKGEEEERGGKASPREQKESQTKGRYAWQKKGAAKAARGGHLKQPTSGPGERRGGGHPSIASDRRDANLSREGGGLRLPALSKTAK